MDRPLESLCIPAIPIPDLTTFAEIAPLCLESMEAMEAGEFPSAPFFFFQVCDTPQWKHEPLKPSPNPDRLLCIAVNDPARQVMFSALAEVEKREGIRPRPKLMRVQLRPNAPLKRIYQQMAETPLTVFSITPSNPAGPSIFFLRGAFTTAELRKELPKHVLDPDAGFDRSKFRIGPVPFGSGVN